MVPSWPQSDPRVVLISPLSPDDCVEQLHLVTDAPFRIAGSRPLVGTINGNRLKAFRRIDYRNSFQTQLVAEISPGPGGTRIDCRFGLGMLVKIFMSIWGGILVLAWLAQLIAGARAGSHAGWPVYLGIPGMLVAGGLILATGRFVARDERRFMLELLKQSLRAREATAE